MGPDQSRPGVSLRRLTRFQAIRQAPTGLRHVGQQHGLLGAPSPYEYDDHRRNAWTRRQGYASRDGVSDRCERYPEMGDGHLLPGGPAPHCSGTRSTPRPRDGAGSSLPRSSTPLLGPHRIPRCRNTAPLAESVDGGTSNRSSTLSHRPTEPCFSRGSSRTTHRCGCVQGMSSIRRRGSANTSSAKGKMGLQLYTTISVDYFNQVDEWIKRLDTVFVRYR